LNGGRLEAGQERTLLGFAEIEERLAVLGGVVLLWGSFLSWARREAKCKRVQSVALQHAADAGDNVSVHALDFGWVEGASRLENGFRSSFQGSW
jgi:hypothetical protein